MTEDYKNKLLKWLTGKYDTETGDNTPSFIDNGYVKSNLYSKINEAFPNGFSLAKILNAKDGSGNNNGISILYGYYYADADKTTKKGYIILLDGKANLLQIIKKYSNGTDLSPFLILNVDTSNGNLYGLDYYNSKIRFLLLSNVSVKLSTQSEYSVRLKKYYYTQGNISNITSTEWTDYFIDKNPNSSKYCLCGSQDTNRSILVTIFTINSGASNEWTDITCSYTDNIINGYCYWTDESQNIYLYGGNNTDAIIEYSSIAGASFTSDTKFNPEDYLTLESGWSVNVRGSTDLLILSNNNIYCIQTFSIYNSSSSNYKIGVVLFQFLNNNVTTIINEMIGDEIAADSSGTYDSVKLYYVNNNIFLNIYYRGGGVYTTTFYIRLCYFIYNSKSIEFNLPSITYYELNALPYLIISNIYNLYNIFVISEEVPSIRERNLYNISLVYNSNNYNGKSYQGLNSMVSRSANIYSDNNQLIFARNLYNRTIQNNTTTSTLEIPNTMLNDTTLKLKELVSETNGIIVDSDKEVVKNIYEDLLVNYINNLYIQDKNDTSNIIEKTDAEIRLNNSTTNSAVLDYSDSHIGKYKINYNDNTNEIVNIDINALTIIDNYAYYNINIYVSEDNKINSVELLSNDEKTSYVTIDCSSLTKGLYQIKQKVEVT